MLGGEVVGASKPVPKIFTSCAGTLRRNGFGFCRSVPVTVGGAVTLKAPASVVVPPPAGFVTVTSRAGGERLAVESMLTMAVIWVLLLTVVLTTLTPLPNATL